MTWIPIFHHCQRSVIASTALISITSLSVYGVYRSFLAVRERDSPPSSHGAEEEEMNRWSSSLSDPSHENYNPFHIYCMKDTLKKK